MKHTGFQNGPIGLRKQWADREEVQLERWSGWVFFGGRSPALRYERAPPRPNKRQNPCWIFLTDVRSSADILDWIVWVSAKPWATDAVIAGLVRAFNDIFEPSQASAGQGKTLGGLTDEEMTRILDECDRRLREARSAACAFVAIEP
jgi:hypothetical protein